MDDQRVSTPKTDAVNFSEIGQLNMCGYDNSYTINNLVRLPPKVR